MEVEKRSSKGGFLQLFDWNAKSRKKLFSNKPDLPESSKQGKENLDNLTTSKLHQMNGPSLTGNDWASTMSNDELCGTKAPGVVARLMGLDSLPTLDPSDPSFTPFIDSQSFRHSFNPRLTTEFVDYGMRNKLDGFSRNPIEDRLQKLQNRVNRPIERFQTEVLPPKSAKSVPISHHRMLSPIKSPAFILSKNAAYIMETASKIIEQSPHSTPNSKFPSFRSSSVPHRILDLKEKMEAAKRTSTQKPDHEKRQYRSEIVVLKQGQPGHFKNKNKPVSSSSSQSKTDFQKLERTPSRNRIPTKKKEDLEKKPKKIQKTNDVLAQNNQKQNCASSSHKDRSSLKPRVPKGISGKPTSTKKTVENPVGVKKESLSKPKGISGKKRSTDRVNGETKEKERSIKCNISIDGSSNWESVDRKNGMTDVVSFTFTSPIKKPMADESDPLLTRGLTLKFDDEIEMGSSNFQSFGTPMIDSDALSVLLEQKLKELSSLVDTSSQSDVVNDGCSLISAKSDKICHLSMQKDKGIIVHDSHVDQKLEWQGVQVRECNSNSDESGITSNSTTTLTSNGNKYPYMELLSEEIELQDSATSLPNPIFEFTSMTKSPSQWELNYIKKVVTHVEFVPLSHTQKGINDNLFDQLETHMKNTDIYTKPQRKALFECVSACVDARRTRGFSGSYEEWAKWSKMFEKKDLLVDEIWKEICGWWSMEEMEVDEVVYKDMSSKDWKWLDFGVEAFEEGMVVENDILMELISEIVVDFCLVN